MNWSIRFPRKIRLSAALFAFLGGVIVGSIAPIPFHDYVLSLILVGIGGFLLFRAYFLGLCFLCLATAVAGFMMSSSHAERLILGEPYHYTGKVEIKAVRMVSPPRQRVDLMLIEGDKRGLSSSVYVYDWGYKPGTVVRASLIIDPAKFGWQKGRNILGTAQKIDIHEHVSLPTGMFQFREKVQLRMGQSLPEPYASLAVGLLTGANDNFDPDFREDLSRTGTSHIVAVSGANLTLVALLLQRIGRKKGQFLGFVFACLAIGLYVVLAGANPSILRGAFMSLLLLFAALIGRPTYHIPLLLLTASLFSLVMPLGLVYSLSWQLSFLAFSGLLLVSPLIAPYLTAKMGIIGGTLGETVSAQILVLPLTLYQFHVVSVISFVINAIVLLFVPLAMAVSAVQSVCSLLSVEFGRIFAWIAYPVLALIIKPIQWSSELPFAAYDISRFSVSYFVGSYVVIVLSVAGIFWWKGIHATAPR